MKPVYNPFLASAPSVDSAAQAGSKWKGVHARRFGCLLSLSALTLLGSHRAQATSAFWDGTGTDWAVGTSWSTTSGVTTPDLGNSKVPGSGETATFNATSGNTTVTTTAVTINTILFNGASVLAYTLGTAAGTGQITINDNGAIIINSTVVSNQRINANVVLGTKTAANYSFTNNSATSILTFAGSVSGGPSGGSAGAKVLNIAGAGDILMSGLISNGGAVSLALLKSGLGKLTLSNASSSYTGDTTIRGGTLEVGAAGALGGAATAVVLGDASTAAGDAPALLLNGAFTMARAISVGTGATTAYNAIIGGSNVTLTSTYSGDITLNASAINYTTTLQAATGGTVDFITGVWTTNNRAINIGSIGNTGTVKLSNTLSTTGGIRVNFGTFLLGASDRLSNTTPVTVAGGIFDTGAGLTDTVSVFNMSSGSLNGGGTITATTYGLSGGTVNAKLGTGTLTVTGTVALNGTSAASAINVSSGSLALGSANLLTNNAAAVNISGTGALAMGGFDDVVGAVSLTGGSITGSGGTLTGSSYAVQSGSISAKLGGAGIALTKTTGGIVTLSEANTFTGATTIKAGTLVLAAGGSLASSRITVGDAGSMGAVLDAIASGLVIASGQTVSGIGTINGSTTIQSGGVIAPGNSPGILTNLGDFELAEGSTLQAEINGIIAGTDYDQLNVTGVSSTVTLAGLLSITSTAFTPTNDSLFFLIDNDGSSPISGAFSNAPINGNTYTFGSQQYAISYFGNYDTSSFTGGNDVVLMAVPEPGSALIGGIGVLCLLRRRRVG